MGESPKKKTIWSLYLAQNNTFHAKALKNLLLLSNQVFNIFC